ncbi:MAG: hypothetical protein ABSC94_25665 [Polyangiaceae bacterium]|jgi:hypothetical protein
MTIVGIAGRNRVECGAGGVGPISIGRVTVTGGGKGGGPFWPDEVAVDPGEGDCGRAGDRGAAPGAAGFGACTSLRPGPCFFGSAAVGGGRPS